MLIPKNKPWRRDVNISANRPVPSGDPLAVIYNEGLWHINQVTPLYNMQYQPLKLKQYAAKIRQGLVSVVQSAATKYTVTFDELPDLKYNEADASGLVITVISSSSVDNSQYKLTYIAVLLSWGMNYALDRATHLPYMLDRGEMRISTSVKATLQSLFDCNIRPFSFTQYQLLIFALNFVDNDSSKSTDPFTLIYKTPKAIVKDKLSLTFNVGDITIIWNVLRDEVSHPSQHVSLTYQTLQNQIFDMMDLDVTVFDLCEVNLSKVEIKNNGCVKMKTPEMINCVFTMLNEICDNDY